MSVHGQDGEVQSTRDLLGRLPSEEQAKHVSLARGQPARLAHGLRHVPDRGRLERDGHVGLPHRHRDGFDAEPVPAHGS